MKSENGITNVDSEVKDYLSHEAYTDARNAKAGIGEALAALQKLVDGLEDHPEVRTDMKDWLIVLSSHTRLITTIEAAALDELATLSSAMDALVGLLGNQDCAVNSIQLQSLLLPLTRQAHDIGNALYPIAN